MIKEHEPQNDSERKVLLPKSSISRTTFILSSETKSGLQDRYKSELPISYLDEVVHKTSFKGTSLEVPIDLGSIVMLKPIERITTTEVDVLVVENAEGDKLFLIIAMAEGIQPWKISKIVSEATGEEKMVLDNDLEIETTRAVVVSTEITASNTIITLPNSSGYHQDSTIRTPVKADVIYTANFIGTDEKAMLVEKFHTGNPNTFAHHETIAFRPKNGIESITIGEKTRRRVIGRVTTDQVDVLVLEGEGTPHITLSTAEGVSPVASKKAIEEARQRKRVVPIEDLSIEVTTGCFVSVTMTKHSGKVTF